MFLHPIKVDRWAIYAFCKNRSYCQILEELGGLNKKYHGSRRRLLAIVAKAAEDPRGPQLFPDAISHQVDAKNQIYEFIAGDLRLLWFYLPKERKVIVCTQVFIKKSRKTPSGIIKEAIRIKKRYLADFENNNIKIIDEIK